VKHAIQEQDKDFHEELRAYLAQFSEGLQPIIPLKFNADGSINREGTLEAPCFAGFKEKEKHS